MSDVMIEPMGMPKEEFVRLIDVLKQAPANNPFDEYKIAEPTAEFVDCFGAVFPQMPLRSDGRIRDKLVAHTRVVNEKFASKDEIPNQPNGYLLDDILQKLRATNGEDWDTMLENKSMKKPILDTLMHKVISEVSLGKNTNLEFDLLFDQLLPNGERGEVFVVSRVVPGDQMLRMSRSIHDGEVVGTQIDLITETIPEKTIVVPGDSIEDSVEDARLHALNSIKVSNKGEVNVGGFSLMSDNEGKVTLNSHPIHESKMDLSTLMSLMVKTEGLLNAEGTLDQVLDKTGRQAIRLEKNLHTLRTVKTDIEESGEMLRSVIANIPQLKTLLTEPRLVRSMTQSCHIVKPGEQVRATLQKEGTNQSDLYIEFSDPRIPDDPDMITIKKTSPIQSFTLAFLYDGFEYRGVEITASQNGNIHKLKLNAVGEVLTADKTFEYVKKIKGDMPNLLSSIVSDLANYPPANAINILNFGSRMQKPAGISA